MTTTERHIKINRTFLTNHKFSEKNRLNSRPSTRRLLFNIFMNLCHFSPAHSTSVLFFLVFCWQFLYLFICNVMRVLDIAHFLDSQSTKFKSRIFAISIFWFMQINEERSGCGINNNNSQKRDKTEKIYSSTCFFTCRTVMAVSELALLCQKWILWFRWFGEWITIFIDFAILTHSEETNAKRMRKNKTKDHQMC